MEVLIYQADQHWVAYHSEINMVRGIGKTQEEAIKDLFERIRTILYQIDEKQRILENEHDN